ncbi:MAG TPA: peptidase M14 family protein, partial [Thermoanaerobaculia bacterium]
FAYENLSNAQMKEGAYRGKDDVLLLPSIDPDVIEKGGSEEQRALLPPPYSGGIGAEGGAKLKSWVEDGGTLVALDASSRYVIALFGLPVRNVLDKVPADDFLCPGSMLRVRFDTAQPLAYGMEADEDVYFGDSPAFETRVPDGRFERRVVATYPDNAEDILVSGYLKGGKRLERRVAVVDLTVGKGRVILIGFHPQHRAQPHRTFKLLWNALYVAGLKETELK